MTVRVDGHILGKNLNWEIRSDQQWAVLGPNGSGKSALMKVLAGIAPAVKGSISYHFLDSLKRASAREHIAYVSFEEQRGALGTEAYYQDRWNIGLSEDGQTVSDFLSERGVKHVNRFAVVHEKKDATFPARREKVIRQIGLKPLLHRTLMQLSNGERRKVSIARALLKNPALLILDNPFEGLDARFRAVLKKNLESLMRGDTRVIIAGTGREEMPARITHVLRINDDRTISMGAKTAMLEKKRGAVKRKVHARKSVKRNAARPIVVRMKNVNVAYNQTPVLRKLNWTIREGERWALFGPNGAGKTTLLSLILGDNPQAYANDITLFGRRRGSGESIWEIKKNIGWVSPELQLYYPPEATCLDVVCSGFFDSIGLYRKCSAHQETVARALLKKFGLGKLAKIPFEDISEGEERLVLLSRALVKNPALIVLDEPCQGLDAANRDRVITAIDLVCKEAAATMIYVTHRTDELPKSITNKLVLKKR